MNKNREWGTGVVAGGSSAAALTGIPYRCLWHRVLKAICNTQRQQRGESQGHCSSRLILDSQNHYDNHQNRSPGKKKHYSSGALCFLRSRIV